ncbi:MAG: alanine--tRNA ligase, partial [Candidatus Bathyarchaeia archaeon]
VSPYPIIARWRDDLMVTIASIIDFQPYVTEGIIPPPANPLVVSQPCLRFEDVDLTGVTAGRHLTIFEMGGHHAFNYEGEPQVYWKNETVRYHHELITEELGVPEHMVTYKEGIWSGGGNAGFCLEPCVGGLEISTLVFMMYKVVGDRLEPMPIKVVDTGYGIDRWTWLSQGTPSAFHALYDPILKNAMKWAGLSVDDKLLSELAKHSYLIERDNKEREQRVIADKAGIDYREMLDTVYPIEGIYAALDHTKAITFILSEGVVPSNSGEGYLARMLFRRGYRMLRRSNIEERIIDMVEKQIDLWGGDFPQLRDMRDEVLEMVKVELEKYQDTLSRGRGMVRRYAKRAGDIPSNKLVEFYDSHGLTPEDVQEAAGQAGVDVSIPNDFYTLVAQRHIGEGTKKEGFEDEIAQKVQGIDRTIRLFYDDVYRREFNAEVIEVINDYIILDKTAFYAEGGGQISDTGILEANSGNMRVEEVISVEGVILHKVDKVEAEKGQQIHGIIDWNRRLSLMRGHTATHIILGAARRVLGKHAWQAGVSKGIEKNRLDVSHYARITREELEEIEKLANDVVRERLEVKSRWMQRDRAEEAYGFRLYQGGAVPGREIRIVEIGDWDVEACGGTHLSNTSQAGLIKIVGTESVQDGIERLEYSVGPQALQVVQERERLLMDTAQLLGSPLEMVPDSVTNILNEIKTLRSQLDMIKSIMSTEKAIELLEDTRVIKGVKTIIHSENMDSDFLIEIGNSIERIESRFVAIMLSEAENRTVVKAGQKAVEMGVNAGKITKALSKILGGGGGGAPHFGQGGGADPEKFRSSKDKIERIVEEQIQ